MKAPDHKATICGLIYNLFITFNLCRIYKPIISLQPSANMCRHKREEALGIWKENGEFRGGSPIARKRQICKREASGRFISVQAGNRIFWLDEFLPRAMHNGICRILNPAEKIMHFLFIPFFMRLKYSVQSRDAAY